MCEFDVTLRPGTPFVASPFLVWSGTYDDPSVPDDNPADPVVATIFETTKIQVVLNGRELMAGTGTESQPRPPDPDLHATSAILVLGSGAVYRPLPVGQHTLG